ncbi:DNA-directed RNA polymerase subunit D [Candidatus Woesearchaeota archaeon]|nr:DNA-directed RNA polymerase subunit D [Candidatus Woesearchaeota archaeon]
MTDLQIIEKNKNNGRITFLAKGINTAFANAMRRNMIDTVPVMAVEDVEFRKNTSALYDEIIAHRLGLIPLSTDLKSYNLPAKCKCKGEGCNRCQLKLTINAKGPATIYASDLKSKDPKVKPVYPKIIIAKLLKGQELEIEATAILGHGKNHMKFSPGLIWYKHKPQIAINDSKIKNAEACAQSCPVHVYDANNGKLKINKDNELKCHLCQACVEVSNNAIKVETNPTEFIFNIEPWGQLSPAEMTATAATMFNETLEELDEKLKQA